jgi:hypothetical protein
MDYDLYCRILAQKDVVVEYLDEEISAFRLHKGSKTSMNAPELLKELIQASQRYWPTEFRSDPNTARELSAHIARCQVHHIAAALRRGDPTAVLRSSKSLALGHPIQAAVYACSRILRKPH